MSVLEYADQLLEVIVGWGILFLELTGVCVLLVSSVKAVVDCFRRSPDVRLNLAQGIALALTFKLGGEVLRTVVVRRWNELVMLGAIIVLRGALTFLIHWEIKNEEEDASKKKASAVRTPEKAFHEEDDQTK
ncbi:MAG: DUF1622 domain-containing protein [Lachnospiraceae bacterium]|nr:DUF1622 domain-containing protein [Lachnospiraceae bacterium]